MRFFALAMLIPLAACGSGSDDAAPGVQGTGSGPTRTFAVADFSSVEQRGPDDVAVSVGTGFSVRVEGDPEVVEKVRIQRVGEALRIDRAKTMGVDWNGKGSAKIYVTMPRIVGASLAGSGDMTIDRVEGTGFDGSIAGSGALTLGTVAVDAMEVSIAGAGSAKMRGEAHTLKVSIAGSGDVEAGELTAQQATVKIAGAGDVKAVVNGPASVSIMGAGNVDLGEKARCRVSKMGAGDVRCGTVD